jgi:hypothetical protein
LKAVKSKREKTLYTHGIAKNYSKFTWSHRTRDLKTKQAIFEIINAIDTILSLKMSTYPGIRRPKKGNHLLGKFRREMCHRKISAKLTGERETLFKTLQEGR